MREKLIELLASAYGTSFNAPYLREHELEPLADYLLANGVIVPPCKVGDTVFCVLHHKKEIVQDRVKDFDIWSVSNCIKVRLTLENWNDYVVGEFGKTVFLSCKKAEAALKEGQG